MGEESLVKLNWAVEQTCWVFGRTVWSRFAEGGKWTRAELGW